MTITDFLLARVAEDEREARYESNFDGLTWDMNHVLRECEAKRRIVASHQSAVEPGAYPLVIRLLAEVYADHPDYDPAWGLGRGQNAVNSDLTPTNT